MFLLLLALCPFAAFIYAFKDIKKRSFYIAAMLMFVMLGLSVKVVEDASFSGDITRFLQSAAYSQNVSWKLMFMEKDFVLPLLGKIFCYISDDLRFLAVCFSIIYGLLFLRCFYLITSRYEKNRIKHSGIFVCSLFLVETFGFINALRFSLATYYFIWCLLEIYINKKKIFYLFVLFSPAFHFAYFAMVLLPFVHIFIRQKIFVAQIVFILSFVFITPSVSNYINKFSSRYMSESVSYSVGQYASEDGLERMNERYDNAEKKGSVLRKISRSLVDFRNYALMICAFVLSYIYKKKYLSKISSSISIKKNIQYITLLLLIMSFANISSNVSNGERFYHLTSILSVFLIFKMIYNGCDMSFSLYKENEFLLKSVFSVAVIYGIASIYNYRIMFSYLQLFMGNVFTGLLL